MTIQRKVFASQSVKVTFKVVPLRIASMRADLGSPHIPEEFPFVGGEERTIGSGGIGGGGIGGEGGGARLAYVTVATGAIPKEKEGMKIE